MSISQLPSSEPVRFTYRAARSDGAIESGVVAAPTRESAAASLTAHGLWPLALTPARETGTDVRLRLSARDAALGLRVLATLLESGLSVTRALAALPTLAPERWQPALPALEAAVREGASLGAALERSGLALPPVAIGIVRAGEAGSGLARAVARAAALLEEMAATRAAVAGALAYPVVLAVAGTASVFVLVEVVLPRFGAILADLGETLPASTRLVLHGAMFARAAALPALVALLVLLAVWRAWVGTPEGAERWHSLLLGIPVAGPVRRSAATSRACAALAALLENGVPLAQAVGHAARATGDAAIGARLLAARARIVEGERPSAALAATDALTPVVARLVRAGEETGALATMLGHAARLERERATARLQTAVRLLEPAMILAFAGLVALVAAALLQAIYSVRPT